MPENNKVRMLPDAALAAQVPKGAYTSDKDTSNFKPHLSHTQVEK